MGRRQNGTPANQCTMALTIRRDRTHRMTYGQTVIGINIYIFYILDTITFDFDFAVPSNF